MNKCTANRRTCFSTVGLDDARVEPGLKEFLKYAVRRQGWASSYKRGPWLARLLKRAFIQPFWWVSDYGRSTGRIVAVFFGLAMLFAAVYYVWGLADADGTGIVTNLFHDHQEATILGWLVPIRAVYFSIVTMTTLGFGDMHANAHSVWGHVLLTVQVLLGYALLGALITRLAVLFTGGGPAYRPPERTDAGAERP